LAGANQFPIAAQGPRSQGNGCEEEDDQDNEEVPEKEDRQENQAVDKNP
jgi:hypothetical protein